MRYLLLLGMVLCALFTTAEAWACKCARGGDASPLVANAMSGSVVVVRMETVDVDRGVATVTVEEHWDGPTLPKRLTVVGADGGNCNASLAGMPKGSRWIMVLQLDRPTPGHARPSHRNLRPRQRLGAGLRRRVGHRHKFPDELPFNSARNGIVRCHQRRQAAGIPRRHQRAVSVRCC